MIFGIGLPNYGKGKTWGDIERVATLAEALGYDSVWTTDHVIVPTADVEPYGNIYESIVTLAMVAAITRRVRLGASVLVLPQRNPVLAAKQIATIDAASGGRMIVGVGVGWNETEYKNLSANFHNRGKRIDEDISLLRTLWSSETPSFSGKFTKIIDATFSPLPARREIPIWVGGNTEPALRRAALWGDGWHATGAPPAEFANAVRKLRAFNPKQKLTYSARLNINLDPSVSPHYDYRGAIRRRLTGTDDQVRETLREYEKGGCEYAALWFPATGAGLQQMERFMRDIAPGFK
jgi:probable F420-dependent oxidoreductase